MSKVVLDTNIFISSLINREGKAARMIQEWESGNLEVYTSDPLLDELKRVLEYPKIQKLLKWQEEKIIEYIEYLKFFTSRVSIENVNFHFDEDPDDNHIVSTLIASRAEYLITGDKALLTLKPNYPVIELESYIEKYFI